MIKYDTTLCEEDGLTGTLTLSRPDAPRQQVTYVMAPDAVDRGVIKPTSTKAALSAGKSNGSVLLCRANDLLPCI